MPLYKRIGRHALLLIAAVAVASCSGQKGSAAKLLADIETTVMAASGEAAKYVPDELADVQSKLGALKVDYGKRDYAGVAMNGPAVLSAAQGLAMAAAAKKDQILKALEEVWSGLAGALPNDMTAIQSRIDLLSKKSSKKLAAGIDLDAARSGVGEVILLWSKAQAAFASDNLEEAVATARQVKTNIDALAMALKLDLAAPPAVSASAAPK